MTVKNEADQLIDCLDPIIDLFTQVEIIDTGSTDDTVELLSQRYSLKVTEGELEKERCFSLCDLRNQGFDSLNTPWILCLDADERVARDGLQSFVNFSGDAEGYFTAWHTHLNGLLIEDYKLSLFKKGYQKLGLVHDNVQASFRQHGVTADWFSDLTIEHYPPIKRSKEKHQYYEYRLHCAIGKQPKWVRYYWFLGYRQFKNGEHSLAEQNLQRCLQSQSALFPVEVLNSALVLLHIYSLAREFGECALILARAKAFYHQVESDFEVRINNYENRFEQSQSKINERKTAIAPSFSY